MLDAGPLGILRTGSGRIAVRLEAFERRPLLASLAITHGRNRRGGAPTYLFEAARAPLNAVFRCLAGFVSADALKAGWNYVKARWALFDDEPDQTVSMPAKQFAKANGK